MAVSDLGARDCGDLPDQSAYVGVVRAKDRDLVSVPPGWLGFAHINADPVGAGRFLASRLLRPQR